MPFILKRAGAYRTTIGDWDMDKKQAHIFSTLSEARKAKDSLTNIGGDETIEVLDLDKPRRSQ